MYVEIISEAPEIISAPMLQERAPRHCAATSSCSVTREKKWNASDGRGWKGITDCQRDWRRDPGARVHPKMGNPQRPGLMHTLVLWRSSSSASWQGTMWWFLTFLHGSDGLVGTSPLLGSKGPDRNGLTAKPPDLVLLLKKTAASTKSSRTIFMVTMQTPGGETSS